MKSTFAKTNSSRLLWLAGAFSFWLVPGLLTAQQPTPKATPVPSAIGAKTFDTPQQAADALVAAAGQFEQ